MKKVFFILLCLSIMVVGTVMAENEREEGLLDSLNIKTKNSVKGSVTAEESSVNIGGVEIGGIDAKRLEVDVNNKVQDIESRGNSIVSVGGFSGRRTKADHIVYKAKNTVKGKITALKESQVYVGAAQLDGMNLKNTTIETVNTVKGEIKATKGARVNIGSITH